MNEEKINAKTKFTSVDDHLRFEADHKIENI